MLVFTPHCSASSPPTPLLLLLLRAVDNRTEPLQQQQQQFWLWHLSHEALCISLTGALRRFVRVGPPSCRRSLGAALPPPLSTLTTSHPPPPNEPELPSCSAAPPVPLAAASSSAACNGVVVAAPVRPSVSAVASSRPGLLSPARPLLRGHNVLSFLRHDVFLFIILRRQHPPSLPRSAPLD